MTKYIVPALLTIAVVGFATLRGQAFLRQDPSQGESAKRQATIYATGIIEGATEDIELRTEISGRIARVLVTEGQWVRPDEPLIEIANEDYQHQLALAKAELEIASAKLQQLINGARQSERDEILHLYEAKVSEYQRAEKTWDTVKGMSDSKAITQTEIDRHYHQLLTLQSEVAAAKARMELVNAGARDEEIAIARANVNLATSRLELARVQLERTQLKAPCGGQILELTVAEGESTGPNSTRPAVVMADTSKYFVMAYLEEYDALRVPLGCIARISADSLPVAFEGKLISQSPTMGRKELPTHQPNELFDVRTRKVRLEIRQSPELVSGLPVDVYFELQPTN